MEYNFKDAFIIRTMNEENNDFIITLGDKIATPYHFSNQKEAERAIMKKDWNLIATLVISIAENAIEKYLKFRKEVEDISWEMIDNLFNEKIKEVEFNNGKQLTLW